MPLVWENLHTIQLLYNIDDIIQSNCKETNPVLLALNRNEFFLHLRL